MKGTSIERVVKDFLGDERNEGWQEWKKLQDGASVTEDRKAVLQKRLHLVKPEKKSKDAHSEFAAHVEGALEDLRSTCVVLDLDVNTVIQRTRDFILSAMESKNEAKILAARRLLLGMHFTDAKCPAVLTDDSGHAFFYWAENEKRRGEPVPRLLPCLFFNAKEVARFKLLDFWKYGENQDLSRAFAIELGLQEDFCSGFTNWERQFLIGVFDTYLDQKDSWLRIWVDIHLPRGRISLFNLALGHLARANS